MTPRKPRGGVSKSLAETVAAGDVRASLEALRDRLAVTAQSCEPRELASLAKQLVDVVKAIDALPRKEKSSLDDLADRRTRRLSTVPKPAGSGVKRRAGSG